MLQIIVEERDIIDVVRIHLLKLAAEFVKHAADYIHPTNRRQGSCDVMIIYMTSLCICLVADRAIIISIINIISALIDQLTNRG